MLTVQEQQLLVQARFFLENCQSFLMTNRVVARYQQSIVRVCVCVCMCPLVCSVSCCCNTDIETHFVPFFSRTTHMQLPQYVCVSLVTP